MGYLGEEIKKLGFGLMRLPKKDDVIDVEQTKEMVDLFMEAGFTYFDTAWAYAGSEDAIRQARMRRGLTAVRRKKRMRSLIHRLHRLARDILIFICYITWVRQGHIISMTMTCGTGCRRKRERGLLSM